MNLESIIKFVKHKAAPYVLAPVLAVLPMACGNGDGPNGENHNPAPIDQTSIEPANGSSFNVGDTIPVSFIVPSDEDGDTLTGTVVITGDTDGVPGVSAGDFVREYNVGTLLPGTSVTQDVNTGTDGPGEFPAEPEGTDYTIEVVVDDGNGGSSTADVDVTLVGESENPVKVSGCYVDRSNVGVGLAIQCEADAPDIGDLNGNWTLTGGPDGATIMAGGLIRTSTPMEAADAGLKTYSVTAGVPCEDGEDYCVGGFITSDSYTFTVPVDEHESRFIIQCSDGTDHNLLSQETTIDAIAEQCGDGFNATLKPDYGEADYTLDVDIACVLDAVNSRPAAEREAHQNYNDGTTPADVYSNCTVDFAQVSYHHD